MTYIKNAWKNGDIITAEKLNRIEEGIENVKSLPGPQGPKGDKGDTGPAGPPGPKGDSVSSVTISEEPNNAVELKKDGMWVEDKSDEIIDIKNTIERIACKNFTTLSTDYCLVYNEEITGQSYPISAGINILDYLPGTVGNMVRTEDNYIRLNKGKSYIIRGSVLVSGGNAYYYITDRAGTKYSAGGCSSPDGNSYHDSHATVILEYLKEDTDICLNVNLTTSASISFYNNLSWITVEEIGSKIEFDPLSYVNEASGIEDCPVGHIMAMMGTTAPKHYLICDGAEYNISDYPYLANHISEEFGMVNYFGGDGAETFAVPELRNEFLRGYHGGAAEQLSGEVGEHQNATIHTNICTNRVAGLISHDIQHNGNDDLNSRNADTIISEGKTRWIAAPSTNTGDPRGFDYTSRPTNVAVLYCIKYEPTYFLNIESSGYEKEIVFDGKIATKGSKEIPSIEKYDFIQVYGVMAVVNSDCNHKTSLVIHKDDVLKRDTTVVGGAFLLNGSNPTANRRIVFGFPDYTHISVEGIDGNGYISTIYGYKKRKRIEKAYNRETQSIIIEGFISESDNYTWFDYPPGYDQNNCIIRTLNVSGTAGWFIPHQFDNHLQLQENKICLKINDVSFRGRKVQFELAKRNSVVEQSKYSTEETPIGTWIDDKTIYRKVIQVDDLTFPPSNHIVSINCDMSNIDSIIRLYGRTNNTTGGKTYQFALPVIGTTSVISLVADIPTNTIQMGSTSKWQLSRVCIIIEYTKVAG